MNFIDILVLIPLCWYGFRGFKNGLIYEIASIAAIVLGVWFAYHFSDWLAVMLTDVPLAKPVAFILIFVSVLLLVHLAGKLVTKIVKLAIPGIIDHIFGLLFGVAKVVVVFSALFYAIQIIDPHGILLKKETTEKSITYPYIAPIVPHALHWDTPSEPEY